MDANKGATQGEKRDNEVCYAVRGTGALPVRFPRTAMREQLHRRSLKSAPLLF
jgi:hypothetical protein